MPRQHNNPRTKQRQGAQARPTLVGPRVARIHPKQLGFVFTVNVNDVQASDADKRDHTPTGAVAKARHNCAGVYSILRYWR